MLIFVAVTAAIPSLLILWLSVRPRRRSPALTYFVTPA
jgi:hypothetical protein